MSVVKHLIVISNIIIACFLIIWSGCHSHLSSEGPFQLGEVLKWQLENEIPNERIFPQANDLNILSPSLSDWLSKHNKCLVFYFGVSNYSGELGRSIEIRQASQNIVELVRSDLGPPPRGFGVRSLEYIGHGKTLFFAAKKRGAGLQVTDLGGPDQLQVLPGDVIILSVDAPD